jgi:UrcA family protein
VAALFASLPRSSSRYAINSPQFTEQGPVFRVIIHTGTRLHSYNTHEGSNTMNIRATGKSTVIALVFTASSATSTLLNATMQDVEVSSRTVSFADLNLGGVGDQHTLFQRLQNAARAVCKTREARTTAEMRSSRNCYEEALDAAVTEVGNPGIISLHSI